MYSIAWEHATVKELLVCNGMWTLEGMDVTWCPYFTWPLQPTGSCEDFDAVAASIGQGRLLFAGEGACRLLYGNLAATYSKKHILGW